MILACGLTPAWQHVLTFDQLTKGEVNRAREAHWLSSGKVLNVARALHTLGTEAVTVAPLGGSTGGAIVEDFLRLGANARWVETSVPTRVCTTLLEVGGLGGDSDLEPATELVENGAPLPAKFYPELQLAFAELAPAARTLVLTGSLPEGAPPETFRDLLLAAPQARAVLDIRGPELELALEAKPFLVKPNRFELARTLGREIPDDAALFEGMDELRARGATWVLVTSGAGPLYLVGPEGRLRVVPPRVRSVNPIGCGDCLAAGLACALDEGRSIGEALAFGTASALENLGQVLYAELDREAVSKRAGELRVDVFRLPVK